jgi:hypothetical protein
MEAMDRKLGVHGDQALQDFEASAASAKITDQGDALVTFLTEKGHIAVLMRRVVLERLFEQTPLDFGSPS